jgi:hypothetical protein
MPERKKGFTRLEAFLIIVIVLVAAVTSGAYTYTSILQNQQQISHEQSLSIQTATAGKFGFEKDCSFLIFADGSMIYAENCDTGVIAYSGTVASTIVNEAINALTSGGRIFIKAGTYVFTTTPISLPTGDEAAIGTTSNSNIELYGEGNSTILRAGTNMNGAILGVANVGGWYVHDLQVDGNRMHQSAVGDSAPGLIGMEFYGTNHVRIERCYVHDNKTYGIYVTDYGSDVVSGNYLLDNLSNNLDIYAGPNGGSDYLVQGNIVVGSSDVGLDISGYDASTYISNVVCTGNIVERADLGLDPWGLNSGVGISAGDTGPARNVTISDNQVYGAARAISDGGVTAAYPSYDVQVLGNLVGESTGIGIHADFYTRTTLIEGNYVNLPRASGGALAIVTEPSAVDASIVGNDVNASATSGDLLYIRSPSGLIESNYVEGGGGTSIKVYGQQTLVADNVVKDPGYTGIEVETGADGAQIIGNSVYAPRGSSGGALIYVYSMYDSISANRVRSAPSNGGGIRLASSAVGVFVTDNDVRNNTAPYQIQDGGEKTVIENNAGYNPIGYISSPISSGGITLVDSGSSSTWTSGTTYTNWESPKTLYISGGRVTAIVVDGQVLYTTATSVSITLQPGDTFSITFSSAPTIKVFGQ